MSSVRREDFNSGVFSSPEQLLQGKVAGLNITRSGDPNATPAIILRGPSTMRGGAAQEPFYVIDGVPGASIQLVAPDDIVSIDVLKDASSTAIYGARATNGVIMITTRKAKDGQSWLSYNAYAATEKHLIRLMFCPAISCGHTSRNTTGAWRRAITTALTPTGLRK
ncbi:TonB-dependent receptor plug domain-containing protein [Chitinophaga sedimenti]|uniref:TonB-dependent receptor plug domain-containing protein n=1 Tax=Chitinophaga sedimenti TaxID=2033606 RepID=UPI002003A230|nr:TonB-dependent receptor plug domain-containing protein [Chitinophaga sedimenti]MCK7558337.1 TonB-dependent receptor plug domain-containing protein [Chitinophaga sedimenti]